VGYLKLKPDGYKFRRQHPIKFYVADFYCHSLKLIIEVDGNIHNEQSVALHDAERQEHLEYEGISFLRFTNDQVEHNFDFVKNEIENRIGEKRN